MPRYFFDLYNSKTAPDEEGQELPDLKAARDQAIEAARELMGEDIKQGRLQLSHRIEIRSADETETLTVRFEDAVVVER